MKLLYVCSFCNFEIFETKDDPCKVSNTGKHQWKVVEEIKNNPNFKEIIFSCT